MKRFLLGLFVFSLLGVVFAAAACFALYTWAAQDLPSFNKIADYKPPLVTTVYAKDGSIMGYFYREKRFLAPLERMSEYVPKAFLAAEDDGFYKHEGIDVIAIVRAFIRNLQAGSIRQGGSTITQQIIKRLLLSSERSYERKIKEAILAYRLENYLSKDEILTIYLNQIYLGSGAYGVEAAARTFFAKHVNELSLAEAAVLAGLPQAPTKFNPFKDMEATKARQQYVLGRMRDLNWITKQEYDLAIVESLNFRSMEDPSWKEGAWYVEEVRRRLIDYFSEENMDKLGIKLDRYGEDAIYESGLHVYTAMEPLHQAAADRALKRNLLEATKRHGWRGPIAHLTASEIAEFLAKEPLTKEHIAGKNWAKAVVIKVDAKEATVRIGAYTGVVAVETMKWCRIPNLKIAGDYAPAIRDARKVLKENDVIWVSVISGQGLAAPEAIMPGQPVKLALEQFPDVQGAIVSIEPDTGDVVALVGGYSFQESQFNRATQARRQPGSSFKPIVYSAALDNGFTAGSVVLDAPIVYINEYTKKVWKPENFESNFLGPILLKTALAKSRNLCTVRVAQQIGIPTVIDRALSLGLEGPFPNELSVSLGAIVQTPLSMAEGYTAFANQGVRAKPRFIINIKDAWGNTLADFPLQLVQAISPQNAYIMDYLLKGVVQEGTAGRAKTLNIPVAGKTGTSNEERDAWFVGFTPYLVTAVYIGYDQMTPMGKFETGGRAALPAFVYYSEEIKTQYAPDDFTQPAGIVTAQIDNETGIEEGYSPNSGKTTAMPFIDGTVPMSFDNYSYDNYTGEYNENESNEYGEYGEYGEYPAPAPGSREHNLQNSEDLLKQIF